MNAAEHILSKDASFKDVSSKDASSKDASSKDVDFVAVKNQLDGIARRLHRRAPGVPTVQGITRGESAVLVTIDAMEKEGNEGVHPGDIARKMYTTPSALSQMLKTLDAKGMVSRNRETEDSRAIAVSLTESGRSVIDQVRTVEYENTKKIIDYVGKEDIKELIRILGRVADYFEEDQGQ